MDTGRVYVYSVDMEHNGVKQLQGGFNKPGNNSHSDYIAFIYYFVVNLFTAGYYGLQNIKKQMATLTFKYMLLHIFGLPVGLYAFLCATWPGLLNDIQVKDLPEPARWVFMALGAAYIFYIIMNARENYRKKRIDNDERDYELKRKHLHDKK